MKVKDFNKKLSLNKKTIAHLEAEDMNQVKGGATRLTCLITLCLVCP